MARRPKKLEPITIRLEEGTRAELDRLALEEDRPLAWIVNRALREWLDARKGKGHSGPKGRTQD
jgi:predicted transcriptional regulator